MPSEAFSVSPLHRDARGLKVEGRRLEVTTKFLAARLNKPKATLGPNERGVAWRGSIPTQCGTWLGRLAEG